MKNNNNNDNNNNNTNTTTTTTTTTNNNGRYTAWRDKSPKATVTSFIVHIQVAGLHERTCDRY